MKDIALALGGGGVKGHAHTGVIRALERLGFRIRAIAGTSAGGLWGSLYAFGYSPGEIRDLFASLEPQTIYARGERDGPAWFGLGGIRKMLEDALGDITFEDLRLPFAVTTVDIDTARPVILRSGSVVEAIMATVALPGFFPPVERDGQTLIDGGVLDPVPVSLARYLAPHLPVVAVVLSPPVDGWIGYKQPRWFSGLPFLSERLARMRQTQALNIFLRSIDIGGALLTELRLEAERPDVVLRPQVPDLGLFDPVDIDKIMLVGEQSVECMVAELSKVVSWKAQLARRLLPFVQKPVHPPYMTDFNCK